MNVLGGIDWVKRVYTPSCRRVNKLIPVGWSLFCKGTS